MDKEESNLPTITLNRDRFSSQVGRNVSVKELEKWLKKKSIKKAYIQKNIRNTILKISAATIIIMTIIFAAIFSSHRKTEHKAKYSPVKAIMDGNIIYIKNIYGRTLWPYISHNPEMHMSWDHNIGINFINIDEDNHNEVIARTYDVEGDKFKLTLFDQNGSILWERTISNSQTFNNSTLQLKSDFIPLQVSSTQ